MINIISFKIKIYIKLKFLLFYLYNIFSLSIKMYLELAKKNK